MGLLDFVSGKKNNNAGQAPAPTLQPVSGQQQINDVRSKPNPAAGIQPQIQRDNFVVPGGPIPNANLDTNIENSTVNDYGVENMTASNTGLDNSVPTVSGMDQYMVNQQTMPEATEIPTMSGMSNVPQVVNEEQGNDQNEQTIFGDGQLADVYNQNFPDPTNIQPVMSEQAQSMSNQNTEVNNMQIEQTQDMNVQDQSVTQVPHPEISNAQGEDNNMMNDVMAQGVTNVRDSGVQNIENQVTTDTQDQSTEKAPVQDTIEFLKNFKVPEIKLTGQLMGGNNQEDKQQSIDQPNDVIENAQVESMQNQESAQAAVPGVEIGTQGEEMQNDDSSQPQDDQQSMQQDVVVGTENNQQQEITDIQAQDTTDSVQIGTDPNSMTSNEEATQPEIEKSNVVVPVIETEPISNPIVDQSVETTAPIAEEKIETAPKSNSGKNYFKKIAFLGLEGFNDGNLQNVSLNMLNNGFEIMVDSKNEASNMVLNASDTKRTKVTGVYLRPLLGKTTDAKENFDGNNISIVYSNYIEWIKHFAKESRAFVFFNMPNVQSLSAFSLFLEVSKLYGSQSKPIICIGEAWREKVNMISGMTNGNEQLENMIHIIPSINELEAKLSELNINYSNSVGRDVIDKVVDRRVEGDEKDFMVY